MTAIKNKSISDLIVINKKSIEIITDDLSKVIDRIDKVKIPHEKNNNLVYTIKHGSFTWTPTTNKLDIIAAVKGIHRLTIVSPIQFNISSSSTSGTNNTISTIIKKDTAKQFALTTTDNNLAKVSMTWYVEFVADLSKQIN